MSYSIIYDKQFIKVGDKYIPFVIAGDNNVYDVYNNKRSRDCSPLMSSNRNFLSTEKTLLDQLIQNRNSSFENWKHDKKDNGEEICLKDFDDSYGYYTALHIGGRSATFSQYGGIFKTGIRKALTIEQIRERFQIRIKFSTYSWNKEGTEPFDKTAITSDELINISELAKVYEAETGNTVYLSSNLDEAYCKLLRNYYFPIAKKTTIRLEAGETYYAIKIEDHGYFDKLTSKSVRYYCSSKAGKKFKTEKEALIKLTKLKDRFHGLDFKIESFKY
jgi:hypothetical protein